MEVVGFRILGGVEGSCGFGVRFFHTDILGLGVRFRNVFKVMRRSFAASACSNSSSSGSSSRSSSRRRRKTHFKPEIVAGLLLTSKVLSAGPTVHMKKALYLDSPPIL